MFKKLFKIGKRGDGSGRSSNSGSSSGPALGDLYEIVSRLHKGGQGTVYLAKRLAAHSSSAPNGGRNSIDAAANRRVLIDQDESADTTTESTSPATAKVCFQQFDKSTAVAIKAIKLLHEELPASKKKALHKEPSLLIDDPFQDHDTSGELVRVAKNAMHNVPKPWANEIAIMQKLNHPSIVQYHDAFFSPSEGILFIIMEYVGGGDLSSFIDNNRSTTLRRPLSREIFAHRVIRDVCNALCYMHEHRVVHRDVKPANVMCGNPFKLTDLGMAKDETASQLKTVLGTADYMAPELLGLDDDEGDASYTEKIDMWALGVLTFELVSPHNVKPFDAKTLGGVVNNVMRGAVDYFDLEKSPTGCVHEPCIAFIQSLLVVSPAERASAADTCKHRWLVDDVDTRPAKPGGSKKSGKGRRTANATATATAASGKARQSAGLGSSSTSSVSSNSKASPSASARGKRRRPKRLEAIPE